MDNKTDKSLSADEVNALIEEQAKFKNVSTVNFFGIKLARDSLIISVVSIVVWIAIWYFGNLFKIGKFAIIFFLGFIILQVVNVINSALDTEISVEFANYEYYNQINRIEGAFGIIILVFVFLYNIDMDKEYKYFVYKLLVIISLLLSLSVVEYNSKNVTTNIRTIRISIQKFYNQGIILFMLAMVLIFLGIKSKK